MIAASGAVVYDVVTCVTPALMPHLEDFCRHLIENGILHWRIFTIFPVGRAAEDRSLTLSDGEFRQLMKFIRRMRAKVSWLVTKPKSGMYSTIVRLGLRRPRYVLTEPFRVVRRSVPTTIREISTATISGMYGPTVSGSSAGATGCDATNVPRAACSVTVRAAGCTCATAKGACSCATTTNFK